MRRFAMLGLALTLAGCGYNTWWNAPLTPGYQPYAPRGDAENLREVKGAQCRAAAVDAAAGRCVAWPAASDADAAGAGATGDDAAAGASGAGLAAEPWRGAAGDDGDAAQSPPQVSPQVSHGSSTPPGSNQPGLAPLPAVPPAVAAECPGRAAAGAPAHGQAVQTPSGTGVTTGGTQGYQTLTMPGGGSAIVVPNGNGTSTVIKSDGTIETISDEARRRSEAHGRHRQAPDDPVFRLAARARRHGGGGSCRCRRVWRRSATWWSIWRRAAPGYAAAFANRRSVRCAVNQEFAPATAALHPGDEVAFFPPVTGG